MKTDAFWRLLRTYPEASKLWAGETTAAFGSYFFTVALMWYVFSRTGSGLETGLVVIVSFLPTVVVGPWFGVLADRHNQQRLMMTANVASATLAGVLAWSVADHTGGLWLVYVVRGCMGVASTLYDPARYAVFVDLFDQKDLLTAHALFHTSSQSARMVGSATGGLVVALMGAAPTMTLDVVTFFLAALWVSRIRGLRPQTSDQAHLDEATGWAKAREGLRWMRDRPVLLVTLGIATISNVALGPTNVLPPMLIRDSFHATAATLGVFDAAIGCGIVLGGLLIGMLTIRRMGLSMAVALALECLGLTLVAASPTPLVADAGNLLLGIGLVTANAPGAAMMQTLVPRELLGRVSSLSGMMSGFSVPIAFAGAGVVGDALGAHWTYGLAAMLMGITVLSALAIPGIRRFHLPEPTLSIAGVAEE